MKTRLHDTTPCNPRHLTQQGFSLMEILISIAVLGAVSTLIAQVLFTTTHVNKKTDILRNIKQNGEFTLDVIDRLVRNANAIETVCDPGELSTSTAVVRNADDNTTTLTCVSDGTIAHIASISGTGGAPVYLSGATATLSESGGATCADSTLVFSCPIAGVPGPMTVSFSLTSPGATTSAFEKATSFFQSTVSVRN